uniref:zinc finger protein ZXDC n=1 Tax=Ictidomys tridecemlineatus TaxID=43179 RepID=UPI001A9FE349|nr:zinc finger protein ZXDC [Ictidomys tridecemlineatus]
MDTSVGRPQPCTLAKLLTNQLLRRPLEVSLADDPEPPPSNGSEPSAQRDAPAGAPPTVQRRPAHNATVPPLKATRTAPRPRPSAPHPQLHGQGPAPRRRAHSPHGTGTRRPAHNTTAPPIGAARKAPRHPHSAPGSQHPTPPPRRHAQGPTTRRPALTPRPRPTTPRARHDGPAAPARHAPCSLWRTRGSELDSRPCSAPGLGGDLFWRRRPLGVARMPGRGGPLFLRGGGTDAAAGPKMDLPALLAAPPPGYRCPEPQCALAFAKKQQLQVHLLTHGGPQARRPFKCPLDGCGWAFTTSYKLKRHLQSHDKLRPFGCPVGGCGKKFTTVYNLKAHMRGHEQESLFKCEVCAERFPTHAKLSSHQRSHFEPERPYKCDFPGCEKTFITVSALFSHSRAHFREQELFPCSFPGCSKQYDKACRLKIHLRSHTGERPFICDSDSCGWTFTSMSKLLRHKRKHDDDRRFTCPVEGCGKSFTRAEHLKGHSITHLGTKPFECPVEGCCARFSARSSLYIHSKKHLQDVGAPKSRCPVSSCNRLFTSKHSMKAHVVRQHSQRPDLVPPLEAPSSLTPSSELSGPGQSELSSLDLAALFSEPPASGGAAAAGSEEALSSGILTIDVTSVSSSLGGTLPANSSSLGPMDPLVLVAHSDLPPSLESPLILGTAATVLPPGSFSVEDVHAVTTGPVGCLVALPVGQDPGALTSSGNLAAHATTPACSSVPELPAPVKVERDPPVASQQASHAPPPPASCSPPEQHSARGTEPAAGPGGLYLLCDVGLPRVPEYKWCVVTGPQESGGSARTDSRAVQLAQKKKEGAARRAEAPESTQRKLRDGQRGPPCLQGGQSSCPRGSLPGPLGGPPGSALTAGLQCVQVPVLQGDPSGEGVLPLALSPQPSAFHPCFTLDLPVYVLQVGVLIYY